MRLCVGAASRRVVEEAAKLQVGQIVASRRQVGERAPGYTGLKSGTLVELVRKLSGGKTLVVRDHGGPYQNGRGDDNWVSGLDADRAVGFDILHLDVSQLPKIEQVAELTRLCKRYSSVKVEVGGERDPQAWLSDLLVAGIDEADVVACVAQLGGRIHGDRQCGGFIPVEAAQDIELEYASVGVAVKAHNADWLGGRQDYQVDGWYNVSPEFANVEIDAWLRVLPLGAARDLLNLGYEGGHQRWFDAGEGTVLERSRAGLRYMLETPEAASILSEYDDAYVRESIRDAITAG